MKKILFVCTGNICRSPMAEGLFNHIVLYNDKIKNMYIASSAGIAAPLFQDASENAIEALKGIWEIDITSHKSRTIDENIINESDLILTMTFAHKRYIISNFNVAKEKVYTLSEFVRNDLNEDFHEIGDPYGMSLEQYKRCSKEIEGYINKLIERLSKN